MATMVTVENGESAMTCLSWLGLNHCAQLRRLCSLAPGLRKNNLLSNKALYSKKSRWRSCKHFYLSVIMQKQQLLDLKKSLSFASSNLNKQEYHRSIMAIPIQPMDN